MECEKDKSHETMRATVASTALSYDELESRIANAEAAAETARCEHQRAKASLRRFRPYLWAHVRRSLCLGNILRHAVLHDAGGSCCRRPQSQQCPC